MTGEEFKNRLSKTGLSFADIARKIGTTSQALNQVFNSTDVKSSYVEKIAEALGIPIVEFYGCEIDCVTAHDHSTAINGNGNTINNDNKFLDLLSKKDEQIDRLLTIIETMQK